MRAADRRREAMESKRREGNFVSPDLEVGAPRPSRPVSGAPPRNVAINLPGIEDEAFRRATDYEAGRLQPPRGDARPVVAMLAARNSGESRGGRGSPR